MEQIIDEIKVIIEDVADIPQDEISAESSMMDDLNLASLEIMSVISEIEQKYSIKISEKELLEISTVKELAEIVKNKYNS